MEAALMRSAGNIKALANQAYDAGDFAGALSLYTQALQADGAASLKHVLYSNRSAAHLAMGDAHQALADASVAVQSKPGWSKAFSRRAVAQMKLKDFAAAAESSLRAYELEGKDHYLTQLVDALMCVFRGVHLVQPGKKLTPGKNWQAGDWAAHIDQGGYQLLLTAASKDGPKWELVRMAAVLQLAGLARCPVHRKHFFVRGGGADALTAYAVVDNVHRLTLPPRMAAVWKFHLGVEYAHSSLLLPAAVGLANLTRLPTCVPELPLGLLMCEHGAGLSCGVSVLRALNHLVSLTVGCHVSQSALATAYGCIVPSVTTQHSFDILLAACGYEALDKLRKQFESEDKPDECNKVLQLLRMVYQHPYHPDNQVPGKEIRT